MKKAFYTLLLLTFFLASCREDIVILPTETEQVTGAGESAGPTGLYLLCEGNMGSNKASLDFMNLRTGAYTTNIYGANNPNVIKDLGDVGNDVDIYGNRLWAVINCSHKVEVMDKNSCVRIGQVEVPNGRYLAFANGKAYVSSYVAPVSLDPNAERGAIFEIDTATLQVTRRCVVGYQPEEIAIIGDRLYVANSGGYRAPNYDSILSVIDLPSFTETRRIPLAINLHNVQKDARNRLWVTSRGGNNQAGKIFVLENEQVVRTFNITANNMHICGDSVYLVPNQSNIDQITIINTQSLAVQSLSLMGTEGGLGIDKPYGLIVNPYNRDILLTDAENYVSSGMLYCFSHEGKCKWQHRTGDIPAHICFLYGKGSDHDSIPVQGETEGGKYLHEVLEYRPAPGQFINLMPPYENGDTEADMVQKCTDALANNARGMVSLGGFGGYLTFRFDHAVQNVSNDYDFQIFGNSFDGTSEPGIVHVSVDANQNDLPDDTWYELAGSEYHADSTTHQYRIMYQYENDSTIGWSDSQAQVGTIYRNVFHDQDYWPQWISPTTPLHTPAFTLLASHTYMNGTSYAQQPCAWGYVDNLPNNDAAGNSFDIAWAVDEAGKPVTLSHIDFIRVHTAVHESNPITGELSTEITNAIDLHYKE